MHIEIFGKKITPHILGNGKIPLLILGSATLFEKNDLLPSEFYNIFTLYFVDMFKKTNDKEITPQSLSLEDFVNQVEYIRIQLNLDKMALFAHSANGVLALEYSSRFKHRVHFNILVGSMPIWGTYRSDLVTNFFAANASDQRKKQLNTDYSIYNSSKNFLANYNSRKAHFFGDLEKPEYLSQANNLWNNIDLDEMLVTQYFTAISKYDVRSANYSPHPTFIALGIYDASCPLYAWTDDFKQWFIDKYGNQNYDHFINTYIFESDHYLMSNISSLGQPDFFVQKIQQFMNSLNTPGFTPSSDASTPMIGLIP